MHKSIFLVPAIFILDNTIKRQSERRLEYEREYSLNGFPAAIKLIHNSGSVNSSFSAHPGKVRAVSTMTALMALAFYAYSLHDQDSNILRYALALVLGGASSNLYDRYRRGYVTDYLRLGGLVWNISDFAIISGAVLAAGYLTSID